MVDEEEKWPERPSWQQLEDRKAVERHRNIVRTFQEDYNDRGAVRGFVGGDTLRALLVANGKCLAKDLRKGYCFSFVGLFKIYEAQSDAVPDDRIEGKVVLPVTDHGLRDGMRTRLDADLICELHERPATWPWPKDSARQFGNCTKCGGTLRPGKVPGGTGWICDCGHYESYDNKEKKEKET